MTVDKNILLPLYASCTTHRPGATVALKQCDAGCVRDLPGAQGRIRSFNLPFTQDNPSYLLQYSL